MLAGHLIRHWVGILPWVGNTIDELMYQGEQQGKDNQAPQEGAIKPAVLVGENHGSRWSSWFVRPVLFPLQGCLAVQPLSPPLVDGFADAAPDP